MTEINVGGEVQDNQYSTLEEAVKNSNDGDTINIHESIEIYDTIIIDHAININGYKNDIKISNMIMGFYIELSDESTVVHLSNMNIIVGESGSFIKGEDNFECTLELDSIDVFHEKFDPETYSLSIDTNSNFGYDLTIKNSHIDGIFTKSYKVTIEDSIIGTPLTLTSKIVGTTNNIKNSQLNNIYIIERGVRDATVYLDNVSTIGALGIRGSLELNGFTVDPLPKDYHSIHGYTSEDDELTWDEVAKRFKAKRDVPALLVYNFPPEDLYYLLDVSLTDLNFPVYEEQRDVFANTNWLYLVNCNTIINDSVIPETIQSNNIQQSGTLKYLNSSDASEWTRKSVNDENSNNDDSTNDASSNNGDEFFEDLDYYNPLRPINDLVGIPDVKKSIGKLVNLADLNDMRTKNGLTTTPMNIIFEGNDGSGKKTVAILFQEALYKSGLIKEDKFINVLASDISRDNISRVIEDAVNGALYIQKIDELVNNNNITILEFTNAIKAVKNDTIVIISGNPNRIETFLKNAGANLSKLFLNKVRFNDYNLDELIGIFDYNLVHQSDSRQFIFTDEAKQLTHELIKSLYNSNQIENNGTFICNELMNNIINEQASRLANLNAADIESEDIRIINETDIENTRDKLLVRTGENSISGSNDALEELNALIGLKNVKQEIKDSINLTRINRKRKELRLPSQSTTMNMLFLGNPGTGKTTVARLYGKALFQHGVLNKDKFTEVNAKDLVGEYVGQTAIKTHNVVMGALDGVLFIDEAYMLASQGGTSFNDEAVAQLLTDIEDNRDSLVVIMAGYTKQINDFISNSNPGIPSRFPIKVEFPDYNSDELVEIFNYECKKRQLTMDEATLEAIRNGIKHYLNEDSNDSIHSDNSLISKTEKYFHKKANKSNGNARFIRNFMDNLVKYQSRRLAMDDDLNVSISDLTTITLADANKAIADLLKVN